ncbi:MAG: hypothetical protein A3F83_14265 [Candidatus Glassbacteria bacterium RIFCSPLOWO2_12_FULL_58_11]|uniref:DUF1722 domain-containing protein n=1 Tax=Candidatus Glassbacteria bacterium RIFCSPLOWO2_12_FULL_58_11 TaxID=1817867 RepID=A0A1F5Z2G3_9BACT|nr:MAG: hypothetical protein A3F83_14265 [Candidatus Glassbacteria bacterium RIFCSPLOWO2_12_FULL_58_11]
MEEKIKLGISACLLGERVRYDGGHKLDRFLTETLGRFVEYVPVCPEVECGLPVPRESMRLVGDPRNPRLVTARTNEDFTERMQSWGSGKLAELEAENLSGFIFKSKSPSSGMERIKVYNKKVAPSPRGVGIWARMFMERFPLLPVEEEGRLHDPELRENFIERIFVLKRWREIIRAGKTLGSLVRFHTRHKLLIMSHSVELYRRLGKLVAEGKKYDPEKLFLDYFELLNKALVLKTTVKKNVNVLQHLQGYFKQHLSADEKQELLEVIRAYAAGRLPLIVPVTLINHFVRRYGQSYLREQYYLNPHPLELKLRTHV